MRVGVSQKLSTRPIKPQAFRTGGRFRGTVSYNRKVFVGGRILFGRIGFRRPHHFRAQKAVSFRANRFPEAASFSGAKGRIISGESVLAGRIIFGRRRPYHFGRIGFRRPHHFRAPEAVSFRAPEAVSFRANRFLEAASFSGAGGRIISGERGFRRPHHFGRPLCSMKYFKIHRLD